jgi:TRAP-type C4-dicarboxylate transport system permease small subunit
MDAKPDRRSQLGRSLFWLGTRIADIGLWAGAAALLAIVVLNAVNIVLRYFFNAPLSWAEEAMLYLMIFGVYVGAVSVAWQQAHIRIDAVLDFAPPARRKVLEIVSTLVLAAVLLPVAYASFGVVSLLFDFDQVSDADTAERGADLAPSDRRDGAVPHRDPGHRDRGRRQRQPRPGVAKWPLWY